MVVNKYITYQQFGWFSIHYFFGVKYWVVFGMLVCEGLIGEIVVPVCEFDELDCECRRG